VQFWLETRTSNLCERRSGDGLGEFDDVAAVVLDHRKKLPDGGDLEGFGDELDSLVLEAGDYLVEVVDPQAEVDVAAAAEVVGDVAGRLDRTQLAAGDDLDLEQPRLR